MNQPELEKLKEKLPEEPGINGKDNYFNSAVLMLMMLIDGKYHFIFQRRSEGVRQPGEICFPGGGYEPEKDKDLEATALRETNEELGIKKDAIEVISKLNTLVSPSGKTIDPFLAIADISSLEELDIDEKEVAEVFTMPVSYFETHKPEEYAAAVEVKPSYVNETGEEVTLFPAKELGVSDIYSEPWGEHRYSIFVYEIDKDHLVWGITARLIHDLLNL